MSSYIASLLSWSLPLLIMKTVIFCWDKYFYSVISWVYFGYRTLGNILEPLLLWSIYGDSLLLDFFAKALILFLLNCSLNALVKISFQMEP